MIAIQYFDFQINWRIGKYFLYKVANMLQRINAYQYLIATIRLSTSHQIQTIPVAKEIEEYLNLKLILLILYL